MKEAQESKYFVNGFLIKYFDVFPPGCNKNNLFDEQKVFLVYLLGVIPELNEWRIDVKYRIKRKEIEEKTNVQLSDEDIDLARLKGHDINKLKEERLISEKKKLIQELNKEFGVKDEEEIILPEKPKINENPKELWDMLQGKGLINNNG